jgi:hypothetical protein
VRMHRHAMKKPGTLSARRGLLKFVHFVAHSLGVIPRPAVSP